MSDSSSSMDLNPVIGGRKLDNGAEITLKSGSLLLEVLTSRMVHVSYRPVGTQPRGSLVVLDREWPVVSWSLEEHDTFFEVATSSLTIKVDRATGSLAFLNSRGNLLLQEASAGRSMVPTEVSGESTYHVEQRFAWSSGEALYGLGQHQSGLLNYRGHDVRLVQNNTEVSVPVLVSSMGYGIYWDNMSETWFRDSGAGDGKPGSIWSEVGDAVDYYFIYGPEMDGVIDGYRQLTGKAPLFPKWAYGLFQSKERYTSQDEILGIVREFRDRQIPLDCIVQDWNYWDPHQWGSHRFDQKRYPDVAGMLKQLHEEYNCHFMISVWSKFVEGSENFAQLNTHGYLFPLYKIEKAWDDYFCRVNDRQSYCDMFNDGARRMFWDQMKNWLYTKGVDGWWMDATEPEMDWNWNVETRKKHMDNALGTGARYLNGYPLMVTKAVYEGQREYDPSKRVFILTRSAFAGQQRNGAATWSGDIVATWDVLKKQIAAGINFCLSGIPYWTTDIGGFFVRYKGGCENDEYRELFVRWFQYGAFCPIFRVHGTSTPREIWRFGEPGDPHYDTLLRFDHLRYRLLPYIYSLAWKVTNENYTIMRGLVFDFPEDPKVLGIADQFMFGPAFLVSPVTEPGVTHRTVYLPQGSDWIDFWTGETLPGGQAVDAPAPLETIPLYVKAGSIVPMGPFIQHASDRPDGPIELRVYSGADANLTLYEDSGDSYAYEKGEHCTVHVKWEERTKTLTIGARSGAYPGMAARRELRIVFVGLDHGVGMDIEERPDLVMTYTGDEIVVKRQ